MQYLKLSLCYEMKSRWRVSAHGNMNYTDHLIYVSVIWGTLQEEFQERDNSWALSKILHLLINCNKHQPLRAGCNLSLPWTVQFQRLVINIKCDDDACFFWSVVAGLCPISERSYRQLSYPHCSNVLCTDSIQLPMSLKQISKFKKHNDISMYKRLQIGKWSVRIISSNCAKMEAYEFAIHWRLSCLHIICYVSMQISAHWCK